MASNQICLSCPSPLLQKQLTKCSVCYYEYILTESCKNLQAERLYLQITSADTETVFFKNIPASWSFDTWKNTEEVVAIQLNWI